jgi:acetate kinase
MSDAILVVNAGSSSIKFSLYVADDGKLRLSSKGQVEGINVAPRFEAFAPGGERLAERRWDDAGAGHQALLGHLLSWTESHLDGAVLRAAGHRVVHGGLKYSAPAVVDQTVLDDLETLVPLAPLHQPHNLAPIRALAELHPDLPQIACFDTAFHHTNPPVARAFALPRALSEAGVRRYGFHGLSYEYIASDPRAATGRVVVAHLGSGASMCALKDGKSRASTMGFTALEGLPMGTRTGSIDPGVLLYLMQERKMDAKAIETLLYKQSGLLGVSGVSNDMRVLLSSDDPHAAEAVDLFVYRIGRELGSLAAAVGGLDALVFTAGIGERSAEIRARVCRQAQWLGVELDEAANAAGGPRISTAASGVAAWVIPTDEEQMIARHTREALRASRA